MDTTSPGAVRIRGVSLLILFLFPLAFLLVSCGGGGGSDTPPPETVVINPAPASGETNVSEYVVIKVEFVRAMDPATVNTSTFLLLDELGTPVTGCVVDYDDVTEIFPLPVVLHIATLNCPVLKPATLYTGRLTTAVTDLAGQALKTDYSWSFTTRTDTGIGQWQSLPASGLTGGKPAVWTGTQMIVWGGTGGARYDRGTNTWLPVSAINAPSARSGHSMVWTGQRMIVWGGQDAGGSVLGDGGIYDPVTDTWQPLPASPGITARAGHSAVWTGTSMLIWGGYVPGTDPTTQLPAYFAQNTGARYSPGSGTWQAINAIGVPSRRYRHTAVWTGDRMIIWGGYGGEVFPSDYTELADGALYDPVLDSWQPMSSVNAPVSRRFHTAVWSGGRMIVWGGSRLAGPLIHTEYLNSGGAYFPATDSWSATSLVGAPDARDQHAAVWTGSEMIVWGGEIAVDAYFGTMPTAVGTGGRYNLNANSWTATAITNAPIPALSSLPPDAVWTGSEMLVWAGGISSSNGGRYAP
jgi:hypothetical protein